MKRYLLPEEGNFYKANLHNHTTVTDGRFTPEEIKELYIEYGYSIVAYTDHEVFVPHNDLTDDSFLALNGFEASINDSEKSGFGVRKTAHICFIALDPDIEAQPCWHRTEYTSGGSAKSKHLVKFDESEPDYVRSYTHESINDMVSRVKQKGFFATYNHPAWSFEDYRDYSGYDGLDAMEIFNGSALVEGYDDYNPRVYDDMLRCGKRLFCVGADDNHNGAPKGSRAFDSGIAYTVIKADGLNYASVAEALKAGSFYASEAPEIYELYVEDGRVFVKCSTADRIFCSYGVRRARCVADETGDGITAASFPLAEGYGYFRITVFDKAGYHACTNAYFEDEL